MYIKHVNIIIFTRFITKQRNIDYVRVTVSELAYQVGCPVCLFIIRPVTVVLLNSRLFSLISLSKCPAGPHRKWHYSAQPGADIGYSLFRPPRICCLRYFSYFTGIRFYIFPSFKIQIKYLKISPLLHMF